MTSTLIDLLELRTNWDGQGSKPPDAAALIIGSGIIATVQERHGLAPAAVVPLPGPGSVSIEWRSDRGKFQADVHPDGSFGYLKVLYRPGVREVEEDESVDSDVVLGRFADFLTGL